MKTSQMKGLYIHGTLSQVLAARNNSAFRVLQLLEGLCLHTLCDITIRGWDRTL